MIDTNDIQALVNLAIINNKQGVINAMNSSGYAIAQNISSDELGNRVWNVFVTKGISELQRVLNKVQINKNTLSAAEQRALAVKFKNADPNAKFLQDVGTWFGDLLGGKQEIVQNPTTVTNVSAPAISGKTILWLAGFGIAAILTLAIIFRNKL